MVRFERIYDLVKNHQMPFYHEILELNMSGNIADMLNNSGLREYANDIKKIKRQIGHDCRVVVPNIHIRDDGFLIDNSFVFYIWGVSIFKCQLDHASEFCDKSLKAIDISIRSYLPEIRKEVQVFKRT